MFTILFMVMNLSSGMTGNAPDARCGDVLESIEAPIEFKTRGKPRRARWEQLDRTLHTLVEQPEKSSDCRLTFDQVFASGRDEEIYVPITHVLLKYVPEEALKGLKVYNQEGDLLGTFESRFPYERTGGTFSGRDYVLYYFQYRTQQGEMQSVPRQPLLDNFLIPWSEIRSRQILGPNQESTTSEVGKN